MHQHNLTTEYGHEALGFLRSSVERADSDEIEIQNVTLRIEYEKK